MVTFLLVLAATFAQHLFQEVRIGELLLGGVLQQCFEPLAALEQTQLHQVFGQSFQLRRIHTTSSICP
jgi:hypothetical protein